MSGFFLHLMRHGAPERPGLLLGHKDVPATPAGISACVAQVASLSFAAAIASDLSRAAKTAAAIAGPRGLSVTQDARWRELDFGAWDGLAPADLDAGAAAAFRADPAASPPPGGETWAALVARIAAALDDIAARDTLVVTHGGAIRAALAVLFGFDQRQLWAFGLPYAAVLTLHIWPGTPRTVQIAGLRA